MRWFVLLLGLGCAWAGDPTAPAAPASQVPVSQAPASAVPQAPKSVPMSHDEQKAGFGRALAAFQQHARQHFKSSDLLISQVDEAAADGWSIPQGQGWLALKVGQAWPFEARPQGAGPDQALRAYVLADGTVAGLDAHLGRLFAEAGAWEGSLDMAAMAQRLVWTLGMGWSLAPYRPTPFALDAAGHGQASFIAQLRPPGPGTLHQVFEFAITLAPDRSATVRRSANLNP